MSDKKTSIATLSTSGTLLSAENYAGELTYSSVEVISLNTVADIPKIDVKVSSGNFYVSTPASRRREEIAQANEILRSIAK